MRGRRRRVGMVLLSTAVVAAFGVACETETAPDQLGTGDCLETPEDHADDPAAFWSSTGEMPNGLPVVACDKPHAAEVFFAEDLWDDRASYPGDEALDKEARTRCEETYEGYVGVSLDYSSWYPPETGWNDGDRLAACIAFDPEGKALEESIKRSAETTFTLRPLSRVAVGDCVETPEAFADDPPAFWEGTDAMPVSLPVVACDKPHAGEVFFAKNAWDDAAEFPGDQAIQGSGEKQCDGAFTDYIGVPFDESRLGYTFWGPSDVSWKGGDRQIGCIVYEPENKPLKGSVKGSGA